MKKSKIPKYSIGQTVIYHYMTEKNKFTIKRIEPDNCVEYPSFIYYDCDKGESGSMLYEEDIDGLDVDCIGITKENLKENGWTSTDFESWEKTYTISDKKFYCTLNKDANTKGRDWCVQVDNDRFCGVGSMDVSTYGQIERFLELLSE